MRAEPTQKPKERQDVAWLRATLVRLLEHASRGEEPDHPACAKYAEILFKMLPRETENPQNLDWLDEARASLGPDATTQGQET